MHVPPPVPESPAAAVRVRHDPAAAPLRMPWRRSVAMGRAHELLRDDAFSHLRRAREALGFEYCRFHGLFHDDMAAVVRDAGGGLVFQWQQIDKVIDRLRSIGMRPFVELGPMPAALASGAQTMFAWKMNVTPPADWAEWSALVEAFVRHATRRYGADEVRRWYFEVWNEPNLDIFWSGTREDYWRLYDRAALAIKGVDPRYRVGGPATARAEWIGEFLDHCRAENVPVDFVSTHGYAQDEFVLHPGGRGGPSAPGDYLRDVFRGVRELVRARAPGLEIHWTEWNALNVGPAGEIDWVANPTVDNAFGGAFVARHAIETDDTCASMAYWTASDVFEELGMPQAPYSGTYGLTTIHGVPKATFRAMELLARMEGTRLAADHASPPPAGCGLVATDGGNGTLRVLLWHNPPPLAARAEPWTFTLELPKPAGRAALVSTRVGPGAGSAYETWVALGRPGNLSPQETELLEAHSRPAVALRVLEGGAGPVAVPMAVAADEVVLLTLGAVERPGISKGSDLADFAGWATGFGAAAGS